MNAEQAVDGLYNSAFDNLARGYDAAFTNTAVGRALRDIVWSRLDTLFRPSQHILELGCGTGEDAVRLAGAGIKVTATDASARMIEVARQKMQRLPGLGPIEFHCLPMESVAAALAPRCFDGVFSNFGAVNCVLNLPSLAADLAAMLAPGAPLIWVVMGRHVPWEWLWYLLQGDRRKALRRVRRDGVEWRGLIISYPTPAQVTAALKPFFGVTRVSPLGCVLPPTYAAAWLNHSPRALSVLTRLELLAQRSATLAAWSDHYILEATRLPVANPLNRYPDGRHSQHA